MERSATAGCPVIYRYIRELRYAILPAIQASFFDIANPLDKIYAINGFLAKLAKLVSFELFRSELEIAKNNLFFS